MEEERVTGTRKPYRISKPREKWTEAEHERFVHAINQHGRNWRKIVQEVGTRSVAQVRSHAQKYFLKLEKNGNTEEVPPARAKRPSTKPYPVKPGTADGSNRSSQSSQQYPETKRPRRLERASTRPLQKDFTLLEESAGPGISTDCDSVAFLLSEEGNGSNHNNNNTLNLDATPNNISVSNTNGNGVLTSQRQSSAFSTAEFDYAAQLADAAVLSPQERLSSEATGLEGERSDPTDASSGAEGKAVHQEPNFGELYDVVGKLYTNQHNHQLMQQLGASQRSELVHMMDQLTDEMRDSVTPRDLSPHPVPCQDRPMADMALGYQMSNINNPLAQHPAAYSHLDQALGSTSSFPSMETLQDINNITAPHNVQGSALLPLDPPPQDLESSGEWKLGLSGDLNAFLVPPATVEYGQYQLPQLIDSKIFDY